VKPRAPFGVAVPSCRQVDFEGQDARCPNAEIDRAQTLEAPQQQSGADEQDERQRNLTHDEHIPSACLTTAPAAAPARLAQHGFEVGSRGLPRRSDSEADACQDRDAEAEREDRALERSAAHAGDRFRRGGQQRSGDRACEQQPGDAAGEREHQALNQQLSNEPPARTAERGAHRELGFPSRSTREKEAGDIDARDDQEQPDGAKQDPEHWSGAAHRVGLQRRHTNRPSRCRRGAVLHRDR
jgi:hypothetical protein